MSQICDANSDEHYYDFSFSREPQKEVIYSAVHSFVDRGSKKETISGLSSVFFFLKRVRNKVILTYLMRSSTPHGERAQTTPLLCAPTAFSERRPDPKITTCAL